MIGLAILLLLIAVFIGSFHLADRLTRSADETLIVELDSLTLEKIQLLESKTTYSHIYYKLDTVPLRLQVFDPNTADSITLLHLGFKPWMVSNMNKYKAKGGKWRTKESVRRIYGMTDDLFAQIENYISIAPDTTYVDSTDTTTLAFHYQVKKDTILELNSCDTTELKYLCGIGSGYAKMIVAYRNRLGGYVSAEQLREIDYIPVATLDSIIPHFIVNSDSVRTINVNRASVKQLQSHPYLNFEKAKSIYELRRKRFRLTSIAELEHLDNLTNQDINRLAPYLTFDN